MRSSTRKWPIAYVFVSNFSLSLSNYHIIAGNCHCKRFINIQSSEICWLIQLTFFFFRSPRLSCLHLLAFVSWINSNRPSRAALSSDRVDEAFHLLQSKILVLIACVETSPSHDDGRGRLSRCRRCVLQQFIHSLIRRVEVGKWKLEKKRERESLLCSPRLFIISSTSAAHQLASPVSRENELTTCQKNITLHWTRCLNSVIMMTICLLPPKPVRFVAKLQSKYLKLYSNCICIQLQVASCSLAW